MSTLIETVENVEKSDHKTEKEAASMLTGGALMVYGIMRRDLVGLLCTAGGAGMIASCAAKKTVGSWAALTSLERIPLPMLGSTSRKIKCKRSVTIAKPIDEVYQFLTNPENFAQFMSSVDLVEQEQNNIWKWTAKNLAGGEMSWETRLEKNDVNKEFVIESAVDSDAAGTIKVACLPVTKARDPKFGTEVHVELDYYRPNVAAAATLFHLFGKDPAQQLEKDLPALKQLLEVGEIARNS